MVPLLVVVKVNAAAELSGLLKVRLLSVLTDNAANVEVPCTVMLPAPEFTTVALPVVLSRRLGVDVLTLPMVPEPELSDTDVVPVRVPVPEIEPAPLALSDSSVPLIVLEPNDMPPPPAVELKLSAPAELSELFTVKAAVSETDKEANCAPPELRLAAPVFVTLAVPVVFKVNEGVVVLIAPMLPEVELSDMEVVPDKLPVVAEIAPLPFVLKLRTVPLTVSLPMEIPALLALVVKLTGPLELSDVDAIIGLLLVTDRELNAEPACATARERAALVFTIVTEPVVDS
jgi:hypothetical protein